MGVFDEDEVSFGRDAVSRGGVDDRGIPPAAKQRLTTIRGDRTAFTSSLSVSEFALLAHLGPAPVAQVLGASVYQVGRQYLPQETQWGGQVFCELDQVSHAWDQARQRALDRLAQEARSVDADAVVGVQLRRGEHDWARDRVDYLVSGTAIRFQGERRPGRLVLSNLSTQDYWSLSRAGWGPAGLVAATAVFFVSQSMRAKWRRRATVTKNQERREFSDAVSAARTRAVDHVRRQANAFGADGIVGVRVTHRVCPDRIRVAIPTVQPSGLSPSTIAIGGGEYQKPSGQENRDGMIITVHVSGTAIHLQQSVEAPLPVMILSARA